MKELVKYRNETVRLEADQNKLKKELDEALCRLQDAKTKIQSSENSFRNKKNKKN